MNKEVDLFIPCCVDQFCPNIAKDLTELIIQLGFTPHYIESQTCCGRVMYDSGIWKQAIELGEKFLSDFKGANRIVSCSGACVCYIKNKYPELFKNSSFRNAANLVSDRLMDITQFIYSVKNDCNLEAYFPYKVFVNHNCHCKNEYSLEEETKMILQQVEGLELVNDDKEDLCCGFGGTLPLYNEIVSQELAKQKVEHALKCGAQYIVSTDSTCLLHLQQYINSNNIALKTIHIVSLLRWKANQNE